MPTSLYLFNLDIEDDLWSKTIMILFIFIYILLGYFYASKFLRIGEGDPVYCNPDSMTFMWLYAWIFGKKSEQEIQKCLLKDNANIVNQIQNPLKVEIDQKKQQIDNELAIMQTNYKKMEKEYNQSETKVNNLAVALQDKVLAIRESIQKIMAAIVVRGHMNDGALKVVKQLSNHDKMFSKALKKINSNDADAKPSASSATKAVAKAATKAIKKTFSKKTFSIKKKK